MSDLIALPPAEAERVAGVFGKNAGEAGRLIAHMKQYIGQMESMAQKMTADSRQMAAMITELNTNTKDVMMRSAGRRAQQFDAMWETQFRPGMQRMHQHMDGDFIPWVKKMGADMTQFQQLMTRMQAELVNCQRELSNFAKAMVAAGG